MALGSVLKEFGVKVSLIFEKKKVEEAQRNVKELGKELKSMGLQVAAAAAALVELANISSEHSRSLQQNSEMLGINVEKLQELEYAAKIAAGVSRDELTGALEGISKTLFDARNGSVEAAQTFIRMGVSLKDISDPAVTADKILGTLADRFQQMPNGIYKTALASAAGGGALVKLLPLLSKGSTGMAAMGREARALGVIMGKGAVDSGAEFDRTLSKIWFVMKNVTYLIGNELIKYLWPVVNGFLKWASANRTFIASGIAGVMKSLGEYLKIVWAVVQFVADRFKALVGVMGGVEHVSKGIAIAMGIFTGAKIIAGLGTLVRSFRAVAGVLGIISWESAAIGAALLALILVVQDLFSSDSVIKEWIGVFEKRFPNVTKFITGIFNAVKFVINDTVAGFKSLYQYVTDTVQAVIDLGKALASGLGIGNIVQDMIGGIKELYEMVTSLAGKGLGGIGDWLTAKTTAQPSSNVSNVKNQQTHLEANVTVQVPPGTSVKDAQSIAAGGVQEGFHATLRHARNQALGGVAY